MAIHMLLCYSPQDKRIAKKLKNHLSMLRYNGLVDIWDHADILPGAELRQETRNHFDSAQVILLLISSTFLASEYFYSVEVQATIRRHESKKTVVIPVILHPVIWQMPPLDKLLPLPDEAKAISDWKTQDKGCENVANRIREVIEQWDSRSLAGPGGERAQFMIHLDLLIERVEKQMQPPPRGSATASTLQQLSILIPNEITLADLVAGWQILAQPSSKEEDPGTIQRRRTCGELASLAMQITQDAGSVENAIKTWESWLTTKIFENSTDPRHVAMVRTFTRELNELRAFQQL